MKVTVDTNILVRAIIGDDAVQAKVAQEVLEQAELVALSLHALCEFCWVARRAYGLDRDVIAQSIKMLIQSDNLACDGPAIEAGLALLEAGGDFADGVIAYTGHWLGGEQFVSFDRRAVALLKAQGIDAMIPR